MHAWAIEGYGAANVGLLGALDDEDIKEIGVMLRYDGGPPPLQIKFITKALASEVAEEAQRAAERDKRRTPKTDFTRGRVAGSSDEAADSNDDESAASGGLDGSESDDEEPARSTGRAPGAAASTKTTRPHSRHGKKIASKAAAGAAAGKQAIPNLFGRSACKKNKHGLGGQAKAKAAVNGRARPFAGLGRRQKGHACVNPCGEMAGACSCPADAEYPACCTGAHECARQLAQIVEGARVAGTRTPSEIVKRSGTASKYNYGRMRVYLLEHAFDGQGNVLVHLSCLTAKLSVSHNFTTSLHGMAVKRANAKTQEIPKSKVLSLKLTEEQVMRPEGSLGSLSTYLSTLQDEDLVTVISQAGVHGLTGKASNGASIRERELFIEFIKEHRSPTGRTQDSSGRYHGAEFYIFSKITELKTQSGRTPKDEEGVLECVFRKVPGFDRTHHPPPSPRHACHALHPTIRLLTPHPHPCLRPLSGRPSRLAPYRARRSP